MSKTGKSTLGVFTVVMRNTGVQTVWKFWLWQVAEWSGRRTDSVTTALEKDTLHLPVDPEIMKNVSRSTTHRYVTTRNRPLKRNSPNFVQKAQLDSLSKRIRVQAAIQQHFSNCQGKGKWLGISIHDRYGSEQIISAFRFHRQTVLCRPLS
jgi:hypothetical protein